MLKKFFLYFAAFTVLFAGSFRLYCNFFGSASAAQNADVSEAAQTAESTAQTAGATVETAKSTALTVGSTTRATAGSNLQTTADSKAGSDIKTAAFNEVACLETDADDSFTVYSDAPKVPAAAAALLNADTGNLIAAQNETKKLPMASTTKIMTALILCERANLNDEVVCTKEMVTVEGSSMGLQVGDRVSYRALLYGMMLPSGNDAATTTAISLGGSLENFQQIMNDRAKALGLENTHFVTPSGLDAEGHYTTVADLAKLAFFAMKNETFKEAVGTEKIVVEYGNPPYRRYLKGHNKLMNCYDGTIGIKTGYTKKSGRCLVSAAKRNGCTLIAVTLNDANTLESHKTLLNYGFKKISSHSFSLPKEIAPPAVISGSGRAKLSVDFFSLGLSDRELERLSYRVSIKPFVYAPLKESTVIGRIDYYIGSELLATVPIKTQNAVSLSGGRTATFFERFLRNAKRLFA